MGIDIDSQKHPKTDLMTIDQCKPLFEWGSGKMNWFPKPENTLTVFGDPIVPRVMHADTPKPKQVVASMLAAGEAANWTFGTTSACACVHT